MQLACRVFPFDEHRPRHPEQDLWPAWGQRAPVGIAFSGGGTRSACLTLGTLRALKHLGLLERTRVLSAASGGSSWVTRLKRRWTRCGSGRLRALPKTS